MGTYDSRRGAALSPNPPDPFIWPEEEQVIDLLDKIDEEGDIARDAVVKMVCDLRTQVAALEQQLAGPAEDRASKEFVAADEPTATPVAWRKFIDSAYERHPRYYLREDTGIGAPEGWEPLYASPPRRPEPPDASRESEYLDALREIAGYLGPLDSTAELMRQCAREALPSETKSDAPVCNCWSALGSHAATCPMSRAATETPAAQCKHGITIVSGQGCQRCFDGDR